MAVRTERGGRGGRPPREVGAPVAQLRRPVLGAERGAQLPLAKFLPSLTEMLLRPAASPVSVCY